MCMHMYVHVSIQKSLLELPYTGDYALLAVIKCDQNSLCVMLKDVRGGSNRQDDMC